MRLTLRSANQFLLFCILTTVILYYSNQLIITLVMAVFLSMLMAPVCSRLDKIMPRALSCLVCVLILLIALSSIILLISLQVVGFSKDLPLIEERAMSMGQELQTFIESKFGVSEKEQMVFLKKQIANAGKSTGAYVGKVLGSVTAILSGLLITLVFTFMLLFGKEKYEIFFLKLYKDENTVDVKKSILEITKVSRQYLTGRVISMSLQAIMFSTGLAIIGVKNALLLGCTAGLLTIFPYIGPVLGGFFPIVVSMLYGDSTNTTLWVVALLFIVQTIDNYFIEPNVVGGKVNLSAMSTILIIIVGGSLWGLAGMVLFVPILAVIKIICSHVESLQPYAYLIGDPDEHRHSMFDWIKKIFKKK